MKKYLLILFLLFSVFTNAQTTYLIDTYEYTTDANVIAAYPTNESYGEILQHDLTSNTSHSGYTASASTNNTTAYKAFSFDDVSTDYWQASTSTGYVQMVISAGMIPTSYEVNAPSANASTYSPKDWTLQGSTNGSSWITLSTVTNQTSWSDDESRAFNCTGVYTAYTYYRLNVTANNGGTYLAIGELWVVGGDGNIWCETTTKKQGSYSLRGTVNANGLGITFTRTSGGSIPSVNLSGVRAIYYHLYCTATGSNINVKIKDAGGTTTTSTYNVSSANTWYWVSFDLSGVSDANKDQITQVIIDINSNTTNTFYIDNFSVCSNLITNQSEQIYPVINTLSGN